MQKRLVKLKKSGKYRAPLVPRNSKFLQAICSSKHQRPTTPHLGHHYIKIPKGHPNERSEKKNLQKEKENVFKPNQLSKILKKGEPSIFEATFRPTSKGSKFTTLLSHTSKDIDQKSESRALILSRSMSSRALNKIPFLESSNKKIFQTFERKRNNSGGCLFPQSRVSKLGKSNLPLL